MGATLGPPGAGPVSREDVQRLVATAIREHELRVALWSGLLGAVVMAGTWHAIWLCR